MKIANFKNKKGFVALMSVVMMSIVLIAFAVLVARASFWARFDLLARENKKISLALAQGCIDSALLGLARGENIALPVQVNIEDLKKCEITEIVNISGDIWRITTRAAWKNSFVNLKAVAEAKNGEFTIKSCKEF